MIQKYTEIELVATHDLNAGKPTEWFMTSNDPQFELILSGPLNPGHYILEFRSAASFSSLVAPTLYIDSGNGYNEVEKRDLRKINIAKTGFKFFLTLPKRTIGLRFDPSTMPGHIEIQGCYISPVSKYGHYTHFLYNEIIRKNPNWKTRVAETARFANFFIRQGWTGTLKQIRNQNAELQSLIDPSSSRRPIIEVAIPDEVDYSISLESWHSSQTDLSTFAIVVHIFHVDLAHEFLLYFERLPSDTPIFISTSDKGKLAALERIFQRMAGRITFRIAPNRGRDIAPKLITFRDVYDRFPIVLHLHSKISDHASELRAWRQYLLETLIGSAENVRHIQEAFNFCPEIGIIAAQHYDPVRGWINWGGNFEIARELASKMSFEIDERSVLDFPSGSMFWARSAALRPLLDLNLSPNTFPSEKGQIIDGTPAHAIERLYFHVCEKAGYSWVKVARREFVRDQSKIIAVTNEIELKRFIGVHSTNLLERSRLPRLSPPPQINAHEHLETTIRHRSLGVGMSSSAAINVAVGIVTFNNDERFFGRLLDSACLALEKANIGSDDRVLIIDNGSPSKIRHDHHGLIRKLPSVGNIGFGAGHNRLMRSAFRNGADLYLALNPDGLLHPNAIQHLLTLVRNVGSKAIVEASQFPLEHQKTYDPVTLTTPWASGACLAITKGAYEDTNGFDEQFFMYCEDVDLSWRARALGIPIKISPHALFLHEVTNRIPTKPFLESVYQSAWILAVKWHNKAFEKKCAAALREIGSAPPQKSIRKVGRDIAVFSDFTNGMGFAKSRW